VLVIFTAAEAAEVKNMTHNSDSRSNKRALLISVLVIGILVAVGCSSEKSKPAGSTMGSSSSTLNQVSLPVTSAPAVAASQSAPQKPAPKKMVRKHASMVTYKDDTYGLSFGYPRKYTLKNGEDLKPASGQVETNFVQPGGLAAVSVELPNNSYPGTDLTSASFQINVNKNLNAEQCGQFAVPQSKNSDKEVIEPTKVRLGEMDLVEVENITGESTKQVDTKYYHVYQNSACYEFALGLSTEWDGNEDGVSLVDREDVFRRLEKILAAVKIKTEAAPAVAVQTTPAPAEIVK
jgi:hypothetical protein